MGSTISNLAAAVVDELNGHTFNPAFEAVRHYLPQAELSSLTSLRVSVVPKSIAINTATRGAAQRDVAIDVAIQKRVDPKDLEAVDALMGLVEDVAEFLRGRRLAGLDSAAWVKTENAPVYFPEHLDSFRVFTSVLTLTYRLIA